MTTPLTSFTRYDSYCFSVPVPVSLLSSAAALPSSVSISLLSAGLFDSASILLSTAYVDPLSAGCLRLSQSPNTMTSSPSDARITLSLVFFLLVSLNMSSHLKCIIVTFPCIIHSGQTSSVLVPSGFRHKKIRTVHMSAGSLICVLYFFMLQTSLFLYLRPNSTSLLKSCLLDIDRISATLFISFGYRSSSPSIYTFSALLR